ncbi:hypothetical protein V8C35DRAFT_54186 [Trichoderma chlorosporum]
MKALVGSSMIRPYWLALSVPGTAHCRRHCRFDRPEPAATKRTNSWQSARKMQVVGRASKGVCPYTGLVRVQVQYGQLMHKLRFYRHCLVIAELAVTRRVVALHVLRTVHTCCTRRTASRSSQRKLSKTKKRPQCKAPFWRPHGGYAKLQREIAVNAGTCFSRLGGPPRASSSS